MAYNEELAERIRRKLARRKGVSERKMFGGIAFMIGGNMSVGVTGDDLMVRVGPDAHAESLALPHTRPMDFTGRPMKGMVFVGPKGTESDEHLQQWIDRGAKYARSLPER